MDKKEFTVKIVFTTTVILGVFLLLSTTYQSFYSELDNPMIRLETSEPGFSMNSTLPEEQDPCPPGTWQDQPNQANCNVSSQGHYALGTTVGRSITKISSSSQTSCGILDDGSAVCWGLRTDFINNSDGISNIPREINVGWDSDVVQISNSQHNCVLLENGSVYCWGFGATGALGINSTDDLYNPSQKVMLHHDRIAVNISAGGQHTCAILDDGSVSCWGNNFAGQIGDGTETQRLVPTQTVSLGIGRTAVAISAGWVHTCAILDDGSVSCWGANYYGQLGDNSEISRSTPTQTWSLGAGRTAIAISAGEWHTCVILDDGSVSCWGRNDDGQLGIGNDDSKSWPIKNNYLGSGRTATAISAGGSHTCAVLDDGSVSCWGGNSLGQLGDGTTTRSLIPTQILSPHILNNSTDISSGGNHNCVLLNNKQVYCWGWNHWGTLGNGEQGSGTGGGPLFSTNPVELSWGEINRYSTEEIPCEYGTYQPLTGQSYCLDADSGNFVSSTGASSQTECLKGTYQPLPGQAICISSSLGHYVPNVGSTYQIISDPGNFVSSTGASSQTECLKGTYQPLPGQAICISSSLGHYVPNVGSTYQIISDPGNFVSSTGASSQTECLKGTYQPLPGQAICISSSPGHYVPNVGSTYQSECPPGTYQPSFGSDICLESPEGTFVLNPGQSVYVECSAGTYQPEKKQTFCIITDPGYFAFGSRSTNQTPCGVGTYQPSSAESSCIDADIGYHVTQEGQSSQQINPFDFYTDSLGSPFASACPTDHITVIQGAVSVDDCLLDTDNDRIIDVDDIDDDNDGLSDISEYDIGTDPLVTDTDGDGISDKEDIFPLDPSEWIDTDEDGTGDNSDFMKTVARYQTQEKFLLDISLVSIILILFAIKNYRKSWQEHKQFNINNKAEEE